MAQTFEIRFERSAGLLGLLTVPENSFRWKGAGTLRVDASGISFAVKRGLLALFPRTRRVAAASLHEVYREGEALHLTFATADSARARVSCWAADADTAAEIVGLLPTRRTLEIEHATDGHKAARPRYDRRLLAAFALLVAVFTACSWLLMPAREAAPRMLVSTIDAPQIAIQVNLAPPELVLPEDFVVAIPHNSPYFAVAGRHLKAFEKDAETLLAEYRVDRALLESGAMDVDTFAGRLANLELRWWNVTYRMLEDTEFGDLALLEFRATLLAGARHWRAFLSGHAQGITQGDHLKIAKSFDELSRAEELLSRARLYLRG